MYAIKRVTKEFDGAIGKHIEKQKIVSCIKKKSEADDKIDELNQEMSDDLKRFRRLEEQYIGDHNGSTSKFKEADPDGYDFFHKFRNSGSEGFVRFDIEPVSKW